MQPLIPLVFPLHGQSLIEASAGTGKTYTISSFYLRLILGHECEPRSVDQILIVTFTNAATNELKERLHARLHQAFVDFDNEHSDDLFVQALIDVEPDMRLAKQRLLVAEQSMDEAAIYTIHSFCQRMLLQHAFESGALYEQTLILDDSEWQLQAMTDFWRQFIVDLPLTQLSLFLGKWPSPESLLQTIRPLLNRDVVLESTSEATFTQSLNRYSSSVESLKHWWLNNQVMTQILEAGLKANAKVAKPETLEHLQRFAQSTDFEFKIGKGSKKESWEIFTAEKMTKAAKKGSKDLSHLDFSRFDELAEQQLSCHRLLKQYYITFSLDWVKQRLVEQKQRFNLVSPDDLLQRIQSALLKEEAGQRLAQTIARQYPVAMVDEFQDTDPIQFNIFKQIYMQQMGNEEEPNEQGKTLVLIGDPKQAIYGFRGGDIFTYLQAKYTVPLARQFTLNTNYRSQLDYVTSLNKLFMPNGEPFQFGEDIPYHQVGANKQASGLQLDEHKIDALSFCFLPQQEPDKLNSWAQSSALIAEHFALKIAGLLQGQSSPNSLLSFHSNSQPLLDNKPVEAKDICIVVRDRGEAQIVKDALFNQNVDSVYLARKSVFAGDVAYQLLLLLRALHSPQDESLVRAALLTELFPYHALEFDQLLQNELAWHAVLACFKEAHQLWSTQGVMRAINHVLQYFEVTQHLISSFDDGLRRITDVRHLGELLQVEASSIQGEGLLLKWFENRLADPNHNHEEQQLRLETDENLVQIITIHASKGLQYPLVFIPFASRYKEAKDSPYHKADEGLIWEFEPSAEGKMLQEQQRMGEDTRLLYVAMTRAIYHCWVGLWNNTLGLSKKNSGFVLSAVGQVLLSTTENLDYSKLTDADIQHAITNLQTESSIELELIQGATQEIQETQETQVEQGQPDADERLLVQPQSSENYAAAQLKRKVLGDWILTSYSHISQQQRRREDDFMVEDVAKAADENDSSTARDGNSTREDLNSSSLLPLPLRFSFERGVNPGSFLHAIYELSDWAEKDSTRDIQQIASEQMKRYGIGEFDLNLMHEWITETLRTPIATSDSLTHGNHAFSLVDIPESQRIPEMEFYLPLNDFHESVFNQLIQEHGFPALYPYDFGKLNGMLKGYIDLTFEYDGRFYVADYKSNYLGDDYSDYQNHSLDEAMKHHDYYLQALFYTVALHRYLSVRLVDYSYDTHIGGACYLFVRGMHREQGKSGVLHFRPEIDLVMALDNLFSGNVDGEKDAN